MRWENIQNTDNSYMRSFLSGSTQALQSIGSIGSSIIPSESSALQRRGVYKPEDAQTPWSDNGEAESAKIAREQQRLKQLEATQGNLSDLGNIPQGNGKFSPYQQAFYGELMNQGLSHNQAIAVMMNVNAENGWNNKYIFGNHLDGKKRAYGALSWQGGREKGLMDLYQKAGLIQNGKLVEDPRVLQLQAQHFMNELRGLEKSNATWFLANQNADPLELARNLNKRVIRSNQSSSVLRGRERAYRQFRSR